MHKVLEWPKDLHESVISRIKIMAKMRTDEHASAQDGKFSLDMGEETVDVRVSILPIIGGENAVLRLLSRDSRSLSLKSLGLSEKDLAKVYAGLKNPHGMILVTGPTGCGKTTTLYEILKILNKAEVNIATIEDPVEYDIEGVSQIQVNAKTNLTFTSGLRAIVRQDPDIIMVGEIRDRETAQIAINAAMTGHLVLSTVHSNDSATTLPRLLDMGIEPFLVASTINLIIAQRLVRKICEKCRYSYALEEEKEILSEVAGLIEVIEAKSGKKIEKIRLYKGMGCKACSNTGYSGRLGIFELLSVDETVRQLVIKRASSGEIFAGAAANGMDSMLHDGLEKVFGGITTISEIIRATRV